MALFTRREKAPAEVLAPLGADERMLAWADTADGSVVVATSMGVWWPAAESDQPERRLMPWQRIDKVVWREGVLLVVEADVVDGELLVDRPPVRVALSEPRDLPPVVRKRVEANIVRTELLRVGGGAVRFVARRQPGVDGLLWLARLEPGTRETDRIRAAISARLEILRADSPE